MSRVLLTVVLRALGGAVIIQRLKACVLVFAHGHNIFIDSHRSFYLLPHFSICSYDRKKTCEPPSSLPCFQETFYTSCQNNLEECVFFCLDPQCWAFCCKFSFHTLFLTGKQQEGVFYRLFLALILTKFSHIEENWSISNSHLTNHPYENSEKSEKGKTSR